MAMGTRKGRERQSDMWIAASAIVETPGNAFYDRLNKILSEHKFDARVEALCRKFYNNSPYGRPSLAPGVYFRALLIGYFEGLDSERGIAWRAADSLSLRGFLGYALDEATPDHSTISRTRPNMRSTCRAAQCWLSRCSRPVTATPIRFTGPWRKRSRRRARSSNVPSRRWSPTRAITAARC